METGKNAKILFITDVHAKIREMMDFFQWIINEKKESIAFAIHLGDFWSGRNYNGKTQVRNEWTDLNIFEKLPFPIYHIKGNEDLTIPEDWWSAGDKMWLMPNQEPFYLAPTPEKNQVFKTLPIYFQSRGEPEDEKPKHPEFSVKDNFDFIFSHRPPLGTLDDTLHYRTHERLSNTGSPMVAQYFRELKPDMLIFGHFHYSNYILNEQGFVTILDKLIRVSQGSDKYRYSYGLLNPFDMSFEVVWKNRPFYKYSIIEKKLIYANKLDQRDLARKRIRFQKKS